MRTAMKLGGYAFGLAGVFAASVGLGSFAGSTGAAPAPHGAVHAGVTTGVPDATDVHVPAGLQVSQGGYRLVPVSSALSTGAAAPFQFRILGPDGAPVTRYTSSHDRDLHLIVVRRDLAGFQHVHPALGADGTWMVPLAVAAPGQYRVFADFQPAGRQQGLTLGVDVPAPGDYQPVALPVPARTATVDGYTVTLDGDLLPGSSSKVTLTVSRDGRPVTDLQPYLGAYGHLVALRDGDLAYLHVHPDGAPGDGQTPAGPQVSFRAEVPSAGSYRLYLDFQHAGRVHTAEFTAVAGRSVAAPAQPTLQQPTLQQPTPQQPTPQVSTPASSAGHGGTDHTHG